jgi:type IV pilus assembly protein PilA
MNTIKCPQCNLINWVTQVACKRCGFEFAYSQPAMPPVSVVNENFSGQQQQQYGATNASYNAEQTGFQPQNNPFARPTEFNQSSQYSQQNNYRQNNQQQNYQPNYNQNPRYQKSGKKIKLAVFSLVFGILGFPPIIIFVMGFLVILLAAAFGTAGGFAGLLISVMLVPAAFICGTVAFLRTKKSPQEYGGKGMAIAGIVLSLLTVLIVPIVGVIAIPNLLAARRAANEGSAISTVRNLASAEKTYLATTKGVDCGDIKSLTEKNLIDSSLSQEEKSGYRFRINSPGSGGCELNATPIVSEGVTATGRRSFYMTDKDGWKLHAAEAGGSPAGINDKEIN